MINSQAQLVKLREQLHTYELAASIYHYLPRCWGKEKQFLAQAENLRQRITKIERRV